MFSLTSICLYIIWVYDVAYEHLQLPCCPPRNYYLIVILLSKITILVKYLCTSEMEESIGLWNDDFFPPEHPWPLNCETHILSHLSYSYYLGCSLVHKMFQFFVYIGSIWIEICLNINAL